MNSRIKIYIKKIGFIGFLFFLIKGIIWLLLFYFSGKFVNNSFNLKSSKTIVSLFTVKIPTQNEEAMQLNVYASDSLANAAKITACVNQYLKMVGPALLKIAPNDCVFLKLVTVQLDTMPLLKAKGYCIVEQ